MQPTGRFHKCDSALSVRFSHSPFSKADVQRTKLAGAEWGSTSPLRVLDFPSFMRLLLQSQRTGFLLIKVETFGDQAREIFGRAFSLQQRLQPVAGACFVGPAIFPWSCMWNPRNRHEAWNSFMRCVTESQAPQLTDRDTRLRDDPVAGSNPAGPTVFGSKSRDNGESQHFVAADRAVQVDAS